jgi:multidrug efflux system membrane fusion protein
MLPDSEFHGRISRVSAAADPKSRIFEVEVSIPNQKSELKIGMVATLMVQEDVAQTMDPAVPISALVRSTIHPGGYAVFIASNEGGASRARLRDVEVGTTIGNFIAIKSGTTPGEQIITSGAGLLRDGEPVEIVSGNATLTAER